MSTLRTIELFAGVGGFRLGLEKCLSGECKYKIVWSNQWEPTPANNSTRLRSVLISFKNYAYYTPRNPLIIVEQVAYSQKTQCDIGDA